MSFQHSTLRSAPIINSIPKTVTLFKFTLNSREFLASSSPWKIKKLLLGMNHGPAIWSTMTALQIRLMLTDTRSFTMKDRKEWEQCMVNMTSWMCRSRFRLLFGGSILRSRRLRTILLIALLDKVVMNTKFSVARCIAGSMMTSAQFSWKLVMRWIGFLASDFTTVWKIKR